MAGWTLQVDWLGRTWEWSEIAATLTERMQAYSDSPTFRSVSVSVIFAGVNVSQQYARGERLEGSTARLLLDGAVHLVGVVDAPIFGGLATPTRFSVREVPSDDSGVFPPRGEYLETSKDVEASLQAAEEIVQRAISGAIGMQYTGDVQISPDTFDVSVMTTRALGAVYPYVFGTAGDCSDGSAEHTNIFPAVPVQIVDSTQNDEIVLLAGHALDATNVAIWSTHNGTISARVLFATATQQDLQGRTVAVCNLGGNTTILEHGGSYSTERDLWATYETAATAGGAADVLETVLSKSTARIDWKRVRGLRSWLNRYQLAGCIDEQVTPWQWVQSNILPLLSAAVVMGRDGLYLAPYRPYAEPVATLTDGIDISLDPEIRISTETICNQYDLHYARSEWSRRYARTASSHAQNNAYAAISLQVYRQLHAVEQSTDIVYDSATAQLIAQERVRAQCFAPRLCSGTMKRDRWSFLRCGDKVRITSDALALQSVEALIVAISIDGGTLLQLEIAIVEDPIRDTFDA